MRSKRRFTLTPGGALLLGALVFLLDGDALAALAAAVAVHELGHIAALLALGARIDGVSIAATGPVLHCAAPQFGLSGAIAALSGPFSGLLFCLIMRPHWLLASEMSAVLTAVNLLPLLPLDGGRTLYALVYHARNAQTVLRLTRFCVLAGLVCFGVYAALRGWGAAPILFAFWLFIAPIGYGDTCKTAPDDVKCIC